MKDLLRFRLLDDDICEIKAEVSGEDDLFQIFSATLSVLAKEDSPIGAAIIAAVDAFLSDDHDKIVEDVSRVSMDPEEAMRIAGFLSQNRHTS